MTVICVRETCQYDRNGVCNNECLINPDYLKLAQTAYNTVLRTMQENESSHGDEWLHKPISYHKRHALEHAELSYTGNSKEDDNAHCLTRCAMIKYLEE